MTKEGLERIKEAYYSKEPNSQILLLPILVELTSKEMLIVNQNIEMFENMSSHIVTNYAIHTRRGGRDDRKNL